MQLFANPSWDGIFDNFLEGVVILIDTVLVPSKLYKVVYSFSFREKRDSYNSIFIVIFGGIGTKYIWEFLHKGRLFF